MSRRLFLGVRLPSIGHELDRVRHGVMVADFDTKDSSPIDSPSGGLVFSRPATRKDVAVPLVDD